MHLVLVRLLTKILRASTTTNIMTKSLVISKPSVIEELTPSIRSSIILVCKYGFVAESPKEISVNKGDILKLLDRPGNGWVLVKFVDRLTTPGLVPASYVDIAINDPMHPITLSWLQEAGATHDKVWNESNYLDLQVKQLMRSNTPITINNRPYPVSCSISNCLSYDNRYWYRLDVTYSDGSHSFVCRYYQDFYQLHITLYECKNQISGSQPNSPSLETFDLPKLPEPIPSASSNDSGQLLALLMKRCKDLHVYINKLIANKNYQACESLLTWVGLDYRNLGGFAVGGDVSMSNDEINEKVLPGSINLFKEYKKEVIADRESKSSRGSDLPHRTKLKNIYNHYQQITSLDHKSSACGSPVLRLNTAVSNTHTMPSPEDRSTQDSYNSTLMSLYSTGDRVSPDVIDLDFSFTRRK